MAKEIERKFLLKDDSWRALAEGTEYRQGYLSTDKKRTVRVRTINEKGFLTVKGETIGASRLEFEYEIPWDEALELLNLCKQPVIEKKRYKIEHDNLTWEIDEFYGVNNGLILAEIELEAEGQQFEKPEWIGTEVTHDARYYNSNLTENPFTKWH